MGLRVRGVGWQGWGSLRPPPWEHTEGTHCTFASTQHHQEMRSHILLNTRVGFLRSAGVWQTRGRLGSALGEHLLVGSSLRRRWHSVATTRGSSPSPSRSRPSRSRAVSSRTAGRQRRAREKAACSFASAAALLSAQRLEQDTWGEGTKGLCDRHDGDKGRGIGIHSCLWKTWLRETRVVIRTHLYLPSPLPAHLLERTVHLHSVGTRLERGEEESEPGASQGPSPSASAAQGACRQRPPQWSSHCLGGPAEGHSLCLSAEHRCKQNRPILESLSQGLLALSFSIQ